MVATLKVCFSLSLWICPVVYGCNIFLSIVLLVNLIDYIQTMETPPLKHPAHSESADDDWRTTHLGCVLGNALRRFDARVLVLISQNKDLPLKLANYAARGVVTAAQVHLTRHLALGGSRLVDMAHSAGMSKQAMSQLVQQCEAMGLVNIEPDANDARSKRIIYTETGLLWQAAFREAVQQAQAEMSTEIGQDVTTVVSLGLEAYGSMHAAFTRPVKKLGIRSKRQA
jgi:DNA-binding MarR family transcriptional regulator